MTLGCAAIHNGWFRGEAIISGRKDDRWRLIGQDQLRVSRLVEAWRELMHNAGDDDMAPGVQHGRSALQANPATDGQDHAQSCPAPTILVVEDEMIVALDLQLTLERMGYTVVGIALSGSEALHQAGITCPDVILMDIHLRSDMDGIEAAQLIGEQYSETAIIYLTAQADENTLQRARESHPSDLMFKPFTEKALGTAIETALAARDDPEGV